MITICTGAYTREAKRKNKEIYSGYFELPDHAQGMDEKREFELI